MDLIKGQTLRDLLDEHGRIPVGKAVEIIQQVLSALEEAHRQGILHRDLKPGNVVMDENGRVQILDFGLVKWIREDTEEKQAESRLTATGFIIGTIGYMAPEQVMGDPVDARSDLYAASVILYELIAGRVPHEASSSAKLLRQIMLEEPAPLPGPVGGVLMSGLSREADGRPASAEQFRKMLYEALDKVPVRERTQLTAMAPRVGRELVVDKRQDGRRIPSSSSRAFRLSTTLLLVLALLGGALYAAKSYFDNKRYEELVHAAQLAMDNKRFEDAIEGYEQAREINETTETILGARRANMEFHRAAAQDAVAAGKWQDAIDAWNRARPFSDSAAIFNEPIREAEVQKNFQETAVLVSGEEGAAARKHLATTKAALQGRDEKNAYAALEKKALVAYGIQIEPSKKLIVFFDDFKESVAGTAASIQQVEKQIEQLGESPDNAAAIQDAKEQLKLFRLVHSLQESEVLSSAALADLSAEASQSAAGHEDNPNDASLAKINAFRARIENFRDQLAS
ncbi:MAG: serine/threonine protein kinase, partial [Planctomycetales bacterium]